MTESSTSAESTIVTNSLNGGEPPKLYAGKYKSVEDMEEAVKGSARVYDENQTLKTQLASLTSIPDDYSVPSEIVLRDHEIKEIKSMAKNAGLNQDQFVKTATEMQKRIASQIEAFELAKQSVGEETINILGDYVKKTYPESLQETILNKLIKDKTAMSDALKHRDQLLNSKTPGLDHAGHGQQEKYDGAKELHSAATDYHKDPRNKDKRAKYMRLAKEVGNERFGK